VWNINARLGKYAYNEIATDIVGFLWPLIEHSSHAVFHEDPGYVKIRQSRYKMQRMLKSQNSVLKGSLKSSGLLNWNLYRRENAENLIHFTFHGFPPDIIKIVKCRICDNLTTYRSIAIAVQENHICNQREYQSRNLRTHIPPFSTREFLSFGKYFTFSIYLIVDISKCTLRPVTCPSSESKRDGKKGNCRNGSDSIAIFSLVFIIENNKEGKWQENISAHLEIWFRRLKPLDISDIGNYFYFLLFISLFLFISNLYLVFKRNVISLRSVAILLQVFIDIQLVDKDAAFSELTKMQTGKKK